MKKNILAVIILAATLINLTLTTVLLFVFMPAVKQSNNLITKVAQIIDLELEDVVIKEDDIGIDDETAYELADISLNLTVGPDGKQRMAKLTGTVYLNSKASDYEKINGLMEQNDGKIREVIIDEVSRLTYDEFLNTEKKVEVKETILNRLRQDVFKSECIMSISFSGWVAQ